MTSQIHCPHCGQPVDANARTCGSCGVDLAIAAALAEREILPVRLIGTLAVSPEILVPRLGEYLVERDKLTPADLERALEHQKARAQEGHPLLLGQALRELHLIEPEELDQAITEQILTLQMALRRTNKELEARVHERTLDLEHAIEKLSELNQVKANFIANVSHELRTPLTHIKGYLEMMVDGGLGPLNDPQAEDLTVILRAEARLEGLIDDLIQFALVSRGQLTLNLSAVDIPLLVNPVMHEALYKAKTVGVSMEMEMSRRLPPALCDSDKITWVITQLLDNALKFTPEGGRVKLEALQSNNFVKISVTDTGIGIPSHQLQEIFEPFHQLDGSTTRRYGGTGLGLALSQRILTAHGTQMEVRSEEGQGSQFEFSLPIAERNM